MGKTRFKHRSRGNRKQRCKIDNFLAKVSRLSILAALVSLCTRKKKITKRKRKDLTVEDEDESIRWLKKKRYDRLVKHNTSAQSCWPLLPQEQLIGGKSKPTLVLDLDETLIHRPFDSCIVYFRPWVHEFLERMDVFFELVIFTAAEKDYADEILDQLDPGRRFIKHRLYRDACTAIEGYGYIKDLSRLGRGLSKVIIVDDKPLSFCWQVECGIAVPPFLGDSADGVLMYLGEFLQGLALQYNGCYGVSEKMVKSQCKKTTEAGVCRKGGMGTWMCPLVVPSY